MALILGLMERPTSDYLGVGRGSMPPGTASLIFCRADS